MNNESKTVKVVLKQAFNLNPVEFTWDELVPPWDPRGCINERELDPPTDDRIIDNIIKLPSFSPIRNRKRETKI